MAHLLHSVESVASLVDDLTSGGSGVYPFGLGSHPLGTCIFVLPGAHRVELASLASRRGPC